MLRKFSAFILCLTAVVAVSCTKEIMPAPAAPESYKELLKAVLEDRKYVEVSQTSGKTTLTWEDESTFVITDLEVDDCTGKDPKVIATNSDGIYLVGGVNTRIYRNESLSKENAFPIYAYYTKEGFFINLNNANRLLIKKTERKDKSLPVLRIRTSSAITSKTNYVSGSLTLENPDHMYSDQDNFTSTIRIRGRGNSTWDMPKKPYKFELAEKSKMLGMHSDKDWVLLAEYADKSLLRNITAMELSRICGMKWTPAMRQVELYLNNTYMGVYTLAEHKEVDKNKVNIDVEAGDMYFELEQNMDNPVCWWTEHGAPVMFSDPEYPTQAQQTAAKKVFSDFETALWNKDFDTVYDLIDVDSFINYYIVEEITKDIDGNIRKSTFLTKTVSGKLDMYHLWDFDLTLGNCNYYDDGNHGPTGWWIKDYGYWGKNHGWYYRLFMDKNFVKKVQARWDEVYPELRKVPEFIDAKKALLGDASKRNFQKWNILNTYVWPNYKVLGTYDAEVEWLKTFYKERLSWLDKNIAAL